MFVTQLPILCMPMLHLKFSKGLEKLSIIFKECVSCILIRMPCKTIFQVKCGQLIEKDENTFSRRKPTPFIPTQKEYHLIITVGS